MNSSEGTNAKGTPVGKSGLTFAQLFQGVLVDPQFTFETINNTRGYLFGNSVVQALAFVSLIGAGSGLCQSAGDMLPLISLKLIFAIFSSIMVWIIISICLFALAKRLNRFATISSSLILTAWAHAPLVFLPPIYCLEPALGGGIEILLAAALLWYITLNFIAFKVVLDVSYKRLILTAFITPPVVALSLMFWVYILLSYTTIKLLSLLI